MNQCSQSFSPLATKKVDLIPDQLIRFHSASRTLNSH
jgi:hypothetical protein